MKPDWKDAPEWAQWLAMDKDGSWYWYECRPCVNFNPWWNRSDVKHRVKLAADQLPHWEDTLEQRPEDA